MSKQEAYQQKLEARLDRIAAELAQLQALADEAEADAKLRMYREVDALRARQNELRRQLEELRTAGSGAWEDIRTGAELAWTDLSEAVKRASKHFQ